MPRKPSLLAVAAHPDDESFLFGGALALHARDGGRTGLLCLTDGQAGRTGGLCSRAELPALRRAELAEACDILGIGRAFTPGLMDGGLAEVSDAEGTRIVAEVVAEFGADVLLTFGPEGASGHGDHKACWRWTLAAAGERRVYAATFPERKAPRGGEALPITTIMDVSALGDLKRRAFLAHRTQQYHLALFDEIMAAFDGREYYHRARPAWPRGAPVESTVVPAT